METALLVNAVFEKVIAFLILFFWFDIYEFNNALWSVKAFNELRIHVVHMY